MTEIPKPEASRDVYRLMPTRLQQVTGSGKTRCNLCLWRCGLHHGQRGFCQAHVNRNGTLYNLSYGIISAMAVGAIEDKPVRHYRPGTQVLSVGSYGCSFRCGGCHNLEISWGTEALDALARGESRAAFVPPDQLVLAALESGVQGIAFTYSEPAVWLEYVLDVAAAAHDQGLDTVYVSNSFVTDEALALLRGKIDVLCSDIKSMDDTFYQNICARASVDQVLKSIRTAQDFGIHVETRTNVIPGYNDNDENIGAIAQWIHDNLGSESPWHVTRFHPAYRMMDVPSTPVESLEEAARLGRERGLEQVYIYADKGCDCATGNSPVTAYLPGWASLPEVRKCVDACCGEDGILLSRYEREAGLTGAQR
ncbi:MAG TPA: AmmeMemoRadiSam system radical SAM enzyme [Gammaproteobacteria bacterium]|nr:AmmeMemoRadiSam system radical SAM enzyme [Gammaproteobacteria bacterium]